MTVYSEERFSIECKISRCGWYISGPLSDDGIVDRQVEFHRRLSEGHNDFIIIHSVRICV